jgi:hypothetical protein
MNCKRLSSFTFEPRSQVGIIGDTSFRGCKSLKSICIPASVAVMGKMVFQNCGKLLKVQFEPGRKYLANYWESIWGLQNLLTNAFTKVNRSMMKFTLGVSETPELIKSWTNCVVVKSHRSPLILLSLEQNLLIRRIVTSETVKLVKECINFHFKFDFMCKEINPERRRKKVSLNDVTKQLQRSKFRK